MRDLRAVTLPQPHASLVAAGVQTIVTLPRSTDWRGDLLIHASKADPEDSGFPWDSRNGFTRWEDEFGYRVLQRYTDWPDDPMEWPQGYEEWPMPLGAVVAVARVTDCVPIRDESAGLAAYWPNWNAFWIGVDGLGDLHLWDRDIGVIGLGHQLPYADFTPGRWALLLYDVRPVHVPDVKGRPGLWTPDPDLTRRVKEAT